MVCHLPHLCDRHEPPAGGTGYPRLFSSRRAAAATAAGGRCGWPQFGVYLRCSTVFEQLQTLLALVLLVLPVLLVLALVGTFKVPDVVGMLNVTDGGGGG
jgi:hypothetical protein